MRFIKLLFIPAILASVAVTSCNNENNEKVKEVADTAAARLKNTANDIKDAAQNAANDVKSAANSNADSNFVVRATVSNNEELRILEKGAGKGTNAELKMHARMMLADHKKLGMQLKQYAANKSYTLPAGDDGDAVNIIEKLDKNTTAADWDKAWIDEMVKDHQNDINSFESAKDRVKDATLKSMIVSTLVVLRSHYDMMKGMQDKWGIN